MFKITSVACILAAALLSGCATAPEKPCLSSHVVYHQMASMAPSPVKGQGYSMGRMSMNSAPEVVCDVR